MQKYVSYGSQGIREFSNSLPRSDLIFQTESREERKDEEQEREKLVPVSAHDLAVKNEGPETQRVLFFIYFIILDLSEKSLLRAYKYPGA